jgi:SET domain-containing protein
VENGNEDDKELLFVTSRDIMVGEEIWIDYGRYYNRSGYGMPGF